MNNVPAIGELFIILGVVGMTVSTVIFFTSPLNDINTDQAQRCIDFGGKWVETYEGTKCIGADKVKEI